MRLLTQPARRAENAVERLGEEVFSVVDGYDDGDEGWGHGGVRMRQILWLSVFASGIDKFASSVDSFIRLCSIQQ